MSGNEADSVLAATVVTIKPGSASRPAAVEERRAATAWTADLYTVIEGLFDFDVLRFQRHDGDWFGAGFAVVSSEATDLGAANTGCFLLSFVAGRCRGRSRCEEDV